MRRRKRELNCIAAQNRSTYRAKWNGLTSVFATVALKNRATSRALDKVARFAILCVVLKKLTHFG